MAGQLHKLLPFLDVEIPIPPSDLFIPLAFVALFLPAAVLFHRLFPIGRCPPERAAAPQKKRA